MFRKIVAGAGLMLGALFCASAAMAADAATAVGAVNIPVGDIVTGILQAVQPMALAVLTWVVGRWAPAIVKPVLTDQLLNNALNYGFGAVEGAAKGRTLTVPVANEVIRQASQYAADHGAPWLVKSLGDIQPKLISRLAKADALPPEAHAGNLLE